MVVGLVSALVFCEDVCESEFQTCCSRLAVPLLALWVRVCGKHKPLGCGASRADVVCSLSEKGHCVLLREDNILGGILARPILGALFQNVTGLWVSFSDILQKYGYHLGRFVESRVLFSRRNMQIYRPKHLRNLRKYGCNFFRQNGTSPSNYRRRYPCPQKIYEKWKERSCSSFSRGLHNSQGS